MDDTFEIKDDEIDVEDIMRQIRENIKNRRESGAYDDEMEDIINKSLSALGESHPENTDLDTDDDLTHDLEYINSNLDTHAEYYISSHRPIIGTFLVRGRQMVHAEVRRYVDLIVGKQTEFNAHIACIFKKIINKILESENQIKDFDHKISSIEKDFDHKISSIENDFDHKISSIKKDFDTKSGKIKKIELEVNGMIKKINIISKTNSNDEDIDENFRNILLSMNDKINTINKEISLDLDIDYFKFKQRFGGSEEQIYNKQKKYLRHFQEGPVLDIGCGTGEFLELLKSNGVDAKGIDMNSHMLDICLKKGLNAIEADALDYLQSLPRSSLGGIFMSQIAEHFKPIYLLSVIKEAYDKLDANGVLLLETVNPTSFYSHYNFYIDPTHVQILHPETIKFLLESAGFKDIQLTYTTDLPDSQKLEKIRLFNNFSESERMVCQTLNNNFEKINSILYGPYDYAVIGKKYNCMS